MDGGSCSNSAPGSANFDKSRVLDVKPLRTLVPVFPSNTQGPPFASGFPPFYPFNLPQGVNQQTHSPTPLRSFPVRQPNEVPSEQHEDDDNYEDEVFDDPKPLRKRARKARATVASGDFVGAIGLSQREDGDRQVVTNVLMRFDGLRRKLSQLEDVKESMKGGIKRPDLKAGNILMSKGVRTNMKKRIGAVPGVEIGDIFFFRFEMCLVGLHSQSMAGIDYMIVKINLEDEPLAVSIVSSGGYGDETEDSNFLIYSGHGGINRKEQAADQKLERGNLALERSLHRGSEVRVIRGMKDAVNTSAKVYVYDGLYTIQESWLEKAKSGSSTFKYKLVRVPGQPSAFAIWKSIEKWKEMISSRVGLILPDITSGAEKIPVSLVNEVDEEKGPACFKYFAAVQYPKSFKLTQPAYGCNCQNACQPGNLNCSCIRKNEGDFPYTANGILVSRKPLIHECGSACPCLANCKNRVSQSGLKIRLEVFKTKERGWSLRSWDPVRAGTFICQYAGELIDKTSEDDDYVFDSTRDYESFSWNCESGLIDSSTDASDNYAMSSPVFISAKNIGNVARFMNHSCDPNTFWQPIMYEHSNESFLCIAFFALRHIPPMTELTYDYGISRSDTDPCRKKKCLCGSSKCRGHFG